MKRILDGTVSFFFVSAKGRSKPVVFVPLPRKAHGISDPGFPVKGSRAHLNEFRKILCISNAQVFGKVDAMLEYRVYSASSMIIVICESSTYQIEAQDKPTAEDSIRF
jgi:hypothetical protein